MHVYTTRKESSSRHRKAEEAESTDNEGGVEHEKEEDGLRLSIADLQTKTDRQQDQPSVRSHFVEQLRGDTHGTHHSRRGEGSSSVVTMRGSHALSDHSTISKQGHGHASASVSASDDSAGKILSDLDAHVHESDGPSSSLSGIEDQVDARIRDVYGEYQTMAPSQHATSAGLRMAHQDAGVHEGSDHHQCSHHVKGTRTAASHSATESVASAQARGMHVDVQGVEVSGAGGGEGCASPSVQDYDYNGDGMQAARNGAVSPR